MSIQKRFFYLFTIICLSFNCFAQQNIIEPYRIIKNEELFVYECTTDLPVFGYDLAKGKIDTQNVQIAPLGYTFDIINANPTGTTVTNRY